LPEGYIHTYTYMCKMRDTSAGLKVQLGGEVGLVLRLGLALYRYSTIYSLPHPYPHIPTLYAYLR